MYVPAKRIEKHNILSEEKICCSRDYSYFRFVISKRKINRKIVSLNFMHICKMKYVFERTCIREKDNFFLLIPPYTCHFDGDLILSMGLQYVL